MGSFLLEEPTEALLVPCKIKDPHGNEVLGCEEPQLGELTLRFVPGLSLLPLEQPHCHHSHHSHHLGVPAHGTG